MAYCEFHPDRRGVGVCMRCRAVICPACCTRLDDVNHCHECLRRLANRRPPRQQSSTAAAVLLLLLALGGFFGVLFASQGGLIR
jgi:hypothetical protein